MTNKKKQQKTPDVAANEQWVGCDKRKKKAFVGAYFLFVCVCVCVPVCACVWDKKTVWHVGGSIS